MKVSLIVASGVHQGKAIPIAGTKFQIGRDASCQLRPASQSISKLHCGFLLRDGKVFAVDYGSTNGTSVNNEALAPNVEKEVKHGDNVKAGPLDFTMSIVLAKPSDSTPLPADLEVAKEKLKAAATGSKAGVKPVNKPSSEDDIAAMLMGMGEDDAPTTGSGTYDGATTVMEMPKAEMEKPAEEKKDEKSKIPTREGSSNAASELLRKYMKRPR